MEEGLAGDGTVAERDAQWWAINERQSQFCAVFGNPLRIAVMLELENGERTVGDLAGCLGTSMANLSQHLKLMRAQRCLASRREGRHIYYRVGSPLFIEAMKLVRRGIAEADRAAAAVFEGERGQPVDLG